MPIIDYLFVSTFRYFEDFEKKIPRAEIELIEKQLKKLIQDLDPEFTVTICGSYRFVCSSGGTRISAWGA